MGFFSGANNVSAAGGGSRFKPGIYPAIRVDKLSVKDGHHGLRFIMEGTPVAPAIATEAIDPTPVGAAGSWTVQIDGKYGHIGMGEAKAFVAACLGITPEEANARDMEAIMDAAVGPDQPYRGRILWTQGETKSTASHKIVKHVWRPADADVIASLDPAVLSAPAKTSGEAAAPSAPPAAPAAPPAPPAPPAAPAGPPAPPPGFHHFPEGDPRFGVSCYNASGEVRPL